MTMSGSDVVALLRTRQYLVLLVFAAVLGAPIAAVAYWYLVLVAELQKWLFNPDYLLKALGFHGEPIWWPLPMVGLGGLLVGLAIQYLPGRGGHSPADGFQVAGAPSPIQLPGVALAALAGLAFGAVIGPEAPLIALGGGLAAGAVRLAKRDAPPQAIGVVGASGSFAAVSTLLGSPLTGAFLVMEASGLGGPMLGLVLVPGLVAAGIGSLIFIGFDAWTGHGTFSLAVPNLPPFSHPDGAEFGWAIAIGLAAVVVGGAIRWLALYLKPHVERRIALMAPLVGLGGSRAGHRLRRGERQAVVGSPVLRSGCAALPAGEQRHLLRRGVAVADRLQGTGLRGVVEHLPGRSRLSGHVRRGGGRRRPVPPAGATHGGRRGHGHRGHDLRHAGLAPHLGPVDHPLSGLGRCDRHAPDHRGRGRRLRRPGLLLTPTPTRTRPSG